MLSNLGKIKGNKSKKKRRGRGIGSGVGGHTTGSGHKGQKSRSGANIPVGFEGGQVPLYKRLPSLGGFRNTHAKKIVAIPLWKLNSFADGSEITPEVLVEENIINCVPKDGVKILGNGEISKKLKVKGFKLSSSAKEKIEKAGGKVLS